MNNKTKIIALLSLVFLFQNCQTDSPATFKIAFGSCGHETEDLPIFYEVVKHNPDLFIFLGDNIYGDTKIMDTLRMKYNLLGSKPSYQHLKNNVDILATWDDHDFGWNDAGRHYPFKEESKEIFFDFFDEPKDSDRRKHKGIYNSYHYDLNGKKIQVLLLDTRTFRDDLLIRDKNEEKERRYFYPLDYKPYSTSDSTLLGVEQWNWLNDELKKEADIRIIGSSTQFGIEYNGYEAWANFPHERDRFLELIRQTKANGVIFISGDVHYAEISKLEAPNLYPIYDVTSSGLSSTWYFATPNRNRIEGPIMENHFGMITIEDGKETTIKMETWDIKGNQRIEYSIPISDIQF